MARPRRLGAVRDGDVMFREARGPAHSGQKALPPFPPSPAEPPRLSSAARSRFSSHFCPREVRADCEGQ